MPSKSLSTNTGQKKRGGNNNPTGKGKFTGADDPRRNNAGQRSAAVVATQAEYRALLVQILHEPHGTPLPAEMSNLEVIARVHVTNSKKDSDEREKLLDRIWGKSTQPVDLSSSDGTMTPTAVQIIPYVKPNSDPA